MANKVQHSTAVKLDLIKSLIGQVREELNDNDNSPDLWWLMSSMSQTCIVVGNIIAKENRK